MTDADALYNEAVRYGLDIPEDLHRASPAERAACWNGVGPEKRELVRRVLTLFFGFLAPMCFIHDWRYYNALGTKTDWHDANNQMRRNGCTLIREKLRWWQFWRRPGLTAENDGAHVTVESSEGWKAYQDARAARVAREFTPGPERVG